MDDSLPDSAIEAASDVLSREELELIAELRAEVLTIKDCIARYTIQCLAFVAAVLGAIFALQVTSKNAIGVGVAGVLALFVLRAVSRTAVHKLGTINRNLGYEMHLHRSRRLKEKGGWKNSHRSIGWEEAMRAWRVVQASVFAALCHEASGLFGTGNYRKYYRQLTNSDERPYLWYEVRYLVAAATNRHHKQQKPERWDRIKAFFIPSNTVPAAQYHAGSYVRKMLVIMHRAMYACVVPQLFILHFMLFEDGGSIDRKAFGEVVAMVLVLLATVLWIYIVKRRDDIRLDQLEFGILSIHSCAVLWQAVVVAHFRALSAWQRCRDSPRPEPELQSGYTYNLALQAASLAKEPLRIHQWILDGCRPPRSKVDAAAKLILEDDSRVNARVVDRSNAASSPSDPPRPESFTAGIGLLVDEGEHAKLVDKRIDFIEIGDLVAWLRVTWSMHHHFARSEDGKKTLDRRGLLVETSVAQWTDVVGATPALDVPSAG